MERLGSILRRFRGQQEQRIFNPAVVITTLEKDFTGVSVVKLTRRLNVTGHHTSENNIPSCEINPAGITLLNTEVYKKPGEPFSASLVRNDGGTEVLVALDCHYAEVEQTHPLELISSIGLGNDADLAGTVYVSSGSKEPHRWVFKV